ncbi:MAG: hypothetical protein R6V02_06850 [Candidatus Aminicenantes bacterium]
MSVTSERWPWERLRDRRHADVPTEDIRSDSGFALLSCGEEPCPLSLHTDRLIHHPAPMAARIRLSKV